MFGPDLDTVSRQYSRWSVFRGAVVPVQELFQAQIAIFARADLGGVAPGRLFSRSPVARRHLP